MMHAEDIRSYCMAKELVTEGFPFGESTLVFKVANKVFLLMALDVLSLRFNVKCDPAYALELREQYESVLPGYHMNKKHWNTIIVDGSLPDTLLKKMIDASYLLVKPAVKKKK